MTPRWPVVLFDLDGTVADTITLILSSYAYATDKVLGHAASESEARGWIGQTLADTFASRYPEQAPALMDAYLAFNLANLEAMVRPYPGIDHLLAALTASGVVTGIVTSKRRHSAERTLAALRLADLIDVIGTMEDTDAHKPSPAPLLFALDRLGRRPSEAVYIGDAVVDLQAARAAGMDAIAVSWGAGVRHDLDAAGPVALVDAVGELARELGVGSGS